MAPKARKDQEATIEVVALQQEIVRFGVVGTTPLLCNRQSEKTKRQLLLPITKSRSERGQTAKHDVMQEYRDSPYTISDPDAPSLIAVLAVMFKRAMQTAALETPGDVTKAKIGRLVRVLHERLPVFGVPQLSMMSVVQAGMSRTPDIRTRAILPRWATYIDVSFVTPNLKRGMVAQLLTSAGMMCGIGDGRIEKGALDFGAFRLASEDDEELKDIVASGGRDVQVQAMTNPAFYDDESRDLYEWYSSEVRRREMKVAS